MRVVAFACLLAGCDGIWDLEHIDRSDASQLPADLAAWFPMEDVVDGKVADLAGPHQGTCLAGQCPQAERGIVSYALHFDGTMQLVSAPSSPAIGTKHSFTIALWARKDEDVGGQACPVSKVYLGTITDNSWQFCTYLGSWHFYASPVDVEGPPVTLGQWTHLAATWEQSTGELRLFHNGFAIGQPVLADPPFDDGRVVIGADVDGPITLVYFPGAIDELRIYTRALASSEILKLATVP